MVGNTLTAIQRLCMSCNQQKTECEMENARRVETDGDRDRECKSGDGDKREREMASWGADRKKQTAETESAMKEVETNAGGSSDGGGWKPVDQRAVQTASDRS